jgi:hypothetical protein
VEEVLMPGRPEEDTDEAAMDRDTGNQKKERTGR